MSILLPYSTPTLQHCVTDGYLLGILESYSITEEWLMDHFTNIMISPKRFSDDFYRISMCYETPFLSESRIQYNFIKKLGFQYDEFLKICLENNYYIWLEFNRKYISNYNDKEDVRHTSLVYGFDKTKNAFVYSDFYDPNSWSYPFIKELYVISSELNNSLNNLGYYLPYNSGETDFIRLLRFDSSYYYEFSISGLVEQIALFLEGVNLYQYVGLEINMNYKTIKEEDIKNTYFGINCMNYIAQAVLDENFDSTRPIALLYYFTVMWKKRLTFLYKRGFVPSETYKEMYEQIQEIESKINLVRMIFYKNVTANKLNIDNRKKVNQLLNEYNDNMKLFLQELVLVL